MNTSSKSATFNRTLVFGGARSGKSRYAESLAESLTEFSQQQVFYIATAKPPREGTDSEMQTRIAQHKTRRHPAWQTCEIPTALGAAIQTHSTHESVIVVDCLSVWLSNLLFETEKIYPEVGVIDLPEKFLVERTTLLDALSKATGEIILVSNEVGMGLVPMGAINRLFVDEMGRLNQALAAICERVVWVAAGCPLILKNLIL